MKVNPPNKALEFVRYAHRTHRYALRRPVTDNVESVEKVPGSMKKEWCIYVIEHAVRSEAQEENRHRFWAPITELEGRYLRVITLGDKVTIHNAFPDRGFRP